MKSEKQSPLERPSKPYFTAKDINRKRADERPGEYPFTRGIYSEGYRKAKWFESFASGFGLPEETNEREHYLRSIGQSAFEGRDSINLVFDRPTFLGYDSDHPIARHDIGHVGVIVDTVDDTERLFKGFDLGKLNVGLIVDTTGAIIMAMYIALADRLGIQRNALGGIITNNPCEFYFVARSKTIPPKPALRLAADLSNFCAKEVPGFNICRVNGYNVEEAGGNPVQEVAFTMVPAISFLRECVSRGGDVDEIASRMNFQYAQGRHFFMHICKIRAARRMWARIVKERFGAKDVRSCRMKIHMQTAGATLTAQSPLNNIVRISLQSLSASLSGTQSMHIASYDEALGLPTEESVRIAIMTSKILQFESGICDVVDPLGGSYYIEWLTDQIEKAAQEYMDRIEKMGGFIKAIESGFMEEEIARESFNYERKVAAKEDIVVGVNEYREDKDAEESGIKIFKKNMDESASIAIDRIKKFKCNRNQSRVNAALIALKNAAEDDKANMMPLILQAVKDNATYGEVWKVITDVFGEYRPRDVLA